MSAQYLVSAQSIQNMLYGNGVTFASMQYKTNIATAAKFKTSIVIEKRTTANVMLFQTVKDFEIYRKAVIKSANTIVENGVVTDFEVSENWFEHADKNCFSLISHKTTGEQYLYFIANNAQSQYFVNGVAVDKDFIKEYLTPSKAKEIFENDGVVYNKKNDVLHTMQPRTLKIANIITLTANKQTAIA